MMTMRALLTLIILVCVSTCCTHAHNLSYGYTPPACKQGLNDQLGLAYAQSAGVYTQRLSRQKSDITPGVYQWNMFWQSIESNIPSSSSPLSCPGGYELVPANEAQRIQKGYNFYHCWSLGVKSGFTSSLAQAVATGQQNSIVMWAAPPQYIYGNCRGQGGGVGQMSCVPRDDAMGDWEDYVTYMSTELPLITHWIVWNEVASASWFDYSPIINNAGTNVSASDYQKWIAKYVDMLQRTNKVLQRTLGQAAVIYVSLDQLWSFPNISPANLGAASMLDGIWRTLGTQIDWSVAIHPYLPAFQSAWPSAVRFIDLPNVIKYQQQRLFELGVFDAVDPPQTRIACTEQNSLGSPSDRAAYVCQAHSVMMGYSQLQFTAHNYFQAVDTYDQYSMLTQTPNTPLTLENAINIDIVYAAYASTSTNNWGKNGNHWCCRNLKLGCA